MLIRKDLIVSLPKRLCQKYFSRKDAKGLMKLISDFFFRGFHDRQNRRSDF